MLKLNTYEFFNKNIEIDGDTLIIPEFLTWLDEDFEENIMNYERFNKFLNFSHFAPEFISYLKSYEDDIQIKVIKYDWTISFLEKL